MSQPPAASVQALAAIFGHVAEVADEWEDFPSRAVGLDGFAESERVELSLEAFTIRGTLLTLGKELASADEVQRLLRWVGLKPRTLLQIVQEGQSTYKKDAWQDDWAAAVELLIWLISEQERCL